MTFGRSILLELSSVAEFFVRMALLKVQFFKSVEVYTFTLSNVPLTACSPYQ
ncbi:hypothetical protein D3C72_2416900 [compost metagenome]